MFDVMHQRRAVPLRLPRLTVKEAQALTVISQRAIDFMVSVGVSSAFPLTPSSSLSSFSSSPDGNASDSAVTEGGDGAVAARKTRGGAATWRVSLALGDSAAVRAICDQTLRIDWSGALLRVRIPSRAAAICLASRLGLDETVHMADVDGTAAALVFEIVLNEALEALGAQGLGALHLLDDADDVAHALASDVSRSGDEVADALPYVFVLTIQPQGGLEAAVANESGGDVDDTGTGMGNGPVLRSRILGLVETDGLGVMLLAGLFERQPVMENALDFGNVRVPLRFVIGEAVLLVDRLRALRSGDIIRCAGGGGGNIRGTARRRHRTEWRPMADGNGPGRGRRVGSPARDFFGTG